MSEYVPTTEQVRMDYSYLGGYSREAEYDERQAAFDLWLADRDLAAKAEGWDEGAWHGYTTAPLDYKKNPYRVDAPHSNERQAE
ncbi:hypothetical protein [Citricoccus sp. K5]|uniref:hypothetical protein n=1 Tax=Citricoccus sp. K5 TaxID=2653135 RepID=UPI0012F36B65|nr:hypothetical protein [Citricoccus sp. K5]VXB24199.1 hypothetical protein CITRIK5_30026 [Citricoccus sp. K5]